METFNHPVLGAVFAHPEIGWVLDDNSGAAGDPGDNAYSRHQGPASARVTARRDRRHADNVPFIVTELAADGWWWRITRPESFGLPELQNA